VYRERREQRAVVRYVVSRGRLLRAVGGFDRHYFAKDVDTSGAASELTAIN
jgi:hypothetical protein